MMVSLLQRRLKTGTDDLPREEKLAVLKECLSVIGRRIDIVVSDKRHAGMDADKWRKHLWVYVHVLQSGKRALTRLRFFRQVCNVLLAERRRQLPKTTSDPRQNGQRKPHVSLAECTLLYPSLRLQATTQPVPAPRKSTSTSSRKKAVKAEPGTVHHPLKKIKLTHRAGETTDDQMEE
jgi:hypothetical protein